MSALHKTKQNTVWFHQLPNLVFSATPRCIKRNWGNWIHTKKPQNDSGLQGIRKCGLVRKHTHPHTHTQLLLIAGKSQRKSNYRWINRLKRKGAEESKECWRDTEPNYSWVIELRVCRRNWEKSQRHKGWGLLHSSVMISFFLGPLTPKSPD